MSHNIKCEQCGVDAFVNMSWPTSRGPQTANLCAACSEKFWAQFKNTPAGQGAILRPIVD